MQELTTALLERACRIFLSLSYPGDLMAIPESWRHFVALPSDQLLTSFVTSAACAPGICQVLKTESGGIRGYALRLGSATFPHLKLQVTLHPDGEVVFSVDTHDAYPRAGASPAAHADYAAWTRLQQDNRQLKEKIERAWESDGLMTFNQLLQRDLKEQ
jgi:hypothetical protein